MQIEKNEKNVLELNNVSFRYGDNEVLKDISFVVPEGDYLGVIGPNGAGKTTLLKIILGLLQPATGSAKLFGKDVRKFKEWSRIGYVPQKATNFDAGFPATVEEVVLMGRYAGKGLLKAVNQIDRDFVREALELVDMWNYRNRIIGDLSGGQQQRVFIARALAAKPEVIFLDEPTTGIDEVASESFYALLKKLNQELKMTVILISHDVDMVVKEAKHVACVDRVLVCHDQASEFLNHTKLRDILRGEVKILTHKNH